MKFHKDMLLLYAVTDRKWTGRQTLYEQIEEALKGGATMIQLREKDLPEESYLPLAKQVQSICMAHQVLFIPHTYWRVAQQLGQLDEIVPRYGHVLRDIFGGARGTLCGQVQDGAHAIVRRCLELHDVS